VKARLLDWH